MSDELRAQYLDLRFTRGLRQADVCRKLGVSPSWGRGFEQRIDADPAEAQRLQRHLLQLGLMDVGPPKRLEDLSDLARACLDDFELFRATVFGRRCLPWGVDAAHTVAERYDTVDREFGVINIAPGAGKTTLFTNDIPAWLTCRRRTIRGAQGAVRGELSKKYVARLRKEFERTAPLRATDHAKVTRNALDATATMSQLYGRFRAPNPDAWRREYFNVELVDAEGDGEKEYTWSYASMAGDFIGDRLDFMVWDDAVTVGTSRSESEREKDQETWDSIIEPRLEPGGLLLLVGQRLHPADLYRHNIDKLIEIEAPEDDEPERVPQYFHVCFRAHDDTACTEQHTRDAPAWQPDGEGGCLLDPKALPYRELRQRQSRDPHGYELVYQQNDVSASRALVQPLWINGGRDPATGEIFPGCWDDDRPMGVLPDLGQEPGRVLSYAMVDPSASNYWVIMWVVEHVATERRFLVDARRERMSANALLDLKPGTLNYTGIMEDWQQRSMLAGHRITHWVLEQNSQQKHFMQYAFTREWMQTRQVQVIGHETQGRTKAHAELGVEQTLPRVYKHGLWRMPGTHDARLSLRFLVTEVTSWPNGVTNDGAMCQWFGEYNRPRILQLTDEAPVYKSWRPSWLRGDEADDDYALQRLMGVA